MGDFTDLLVKRLRDVDLSSLTPAGYIDTLRTIGGGLAAQIPAGYAGMYKAIMPGEEWAGAKAVEHVREALTPEPQTEGGRQNLQDMASAVQAVPNIKLPSGFTVGETLAPGKAAFEKGASEHPLLASGAVAAASVLDPRKVELMTTALRDAGRVAMERAARPRPAGAAAAQRGAISFDAPPKVTPEADWNPEGTLPGPAQQTIPGVEPLTRAQQTQQDVADLRRTEAAMPPPVEPPDPNAARVRAQGEAIARLLRERPTGGAEPTADALARERQLLNLKLDAPEAAWPRRQPQGNVLDRQQEIVDTLGTLQRDAERQKAAQEALDQINTLRGKDTTGETLETALRREGDILQLKPTAGYGSDSAEMRRQMDTVRELRRAAIFKANDMTPDTRPGPIPNWAEQLTELPTTRGIERGGMAPAGQDWWNKQFNINPGEPPASVAEFLKHVREVPEAFEYGPMPKNARTLEDFAEHFGEKAGKKINVEQTYEGGSDDYDEPYKIETEKTHGRGELMRDRHGDYKYSDDPKEHERGDYPMYDPEGNVKKKELFGPPLEDEGPLKVERRALGGEVKRDEYGNEKYPLAKSRGGETYRDERGNIKYTKEENPDYSPPEDEDTTYLRVGNRRGEREIKVSGYESDDRPTVYAMDADKEGALLYQTLFAHASKEGKKLGVDSLTGDNQFRMLSNALANAARTGINPRDVSRTASGARPAAKGFAPGERIWQAETGESEARLGQYGSEPDALRFNGTGFEINGEAVNAADLKGHLDKLSPRVAQTKVGPKSLMRGAVYRWLENATPEQAAEAARNWGKHGAPLFGVGGSAVAAALAQHLRNDAQDTQ